MYMSIITAELMLRERQKDLLAEAQNVRMIRMAQKRRTANRSPWRVKLGNILIKTGRRIKGRPGPEVNPLPCR